MHTLPDFYLTCFCTQHFSCKLWWNKPVAWVSEQPCNVISSVFPMLWLLKCTCHYELTSTNTTSTVFLMFFTTECCAVLGCRTISCPPDSAFGHLFTYKKNTWVSDCNILKTIIYHPTCGHAADKSVKITFNFFSLLVHMYKKHRKFKKGKKGHKTYC